MQGRGSELSRSVKLIIWFGLGEWTLAPTAAERRVIVDTGKVAVEVTRECAICGFVTHERVAVCPEDGGALLTRKPDPLIGTVLADRFEIISLIGSGGMGNVYKAHQKLVDRVVAVKVLHRERLQSSKDVLRFQQEAKATAALSHPNIVGFFDYGLTDENVPYIVMDYVEGVSLEAEIKEQSLTIERAIDVFTQACAGLEHAHENGIVHRDIKPSNLMLLKKDDGTEQVKILDFGIAKLLPKSDSGEQSNLTMTGELFGSPQYMSPEQCSGKPMDARSDIYSLGCVMYEALVGRPPFRGETLVDTIYKHTNEAPALFKKVRPDIDIPEQLEGLVMKALEKEPEMRFPSMTVLKRNLEFVPKFAEEQKRIESQPPRRAFPSIRLSPEAIRILVAVQVLALCGSAVLYFVFTDREAKAKMEVAWLELAEGSHSARLLKPTRKLRDLLIDESKHREALSYARQATSLSKESEPNSDGEASDIHSLGMILYKLQDDTAREYLLTARDRFRRIAQANRNAKKYAVNINTGTDEKIGSINSYLGEIHDKGGATDVLNHAEDVRLSGSIEKAEPLYKEALTLKSKLSNEQIRQLCTALQGVAGDHAKRDKTDKAEATYKQAIELSSDTFGAQADQTIRLQRELGIFLQKWNRYALAEETLLDALASANATGGETSNLSIGILEDLGKLYSDMKELKKSQDMKQLAETLRGK